MGGIARIDCDATNADALNGDPIALKYLSEQCPGHISEYPRLDPLTLYPDDFLKWLSQNPDVHVDPFTLSPDQLEKWFVLYPNGDSSLATVAAAQPASDVAPAAVDSSVSSLTILAMGVLD